MIGLYLKKLREMNLLTQDEVAEKLGVTRQAISKWENEKTYPDIENIKCLSELYNVMVDDIVYAGNRPNGLTTLQNDITTEKEQDSAFESEWTGWMLISLAVASCFIPLLNVIISVVFLMRSKKIEQKYLQILLRTTCAITFVISFGNCMQTIAILSSI